MRSQRRGVRLEQAGYTTPGPRAESVLAAISNGEVREDDYKMHVAAPGLPDSAPRNL
jgi:hypothetical protein